MGLLMYECRSVCVCVCVCVRACVRACVCVSHNNTLFNSFPVEGFKADRMIMKLKT
jgi:hypothetical protein